MELHEAVLKAQHDMDRHAESVAVPALVNALSPRRRVKPQTTTLVRRFYSGLAWGMSDCWYWRGARDANGYGHLVAGTKTQAHRVSWELHKGPIPDGMFVLHRCDVRNCVNPEHLFIGTQADNVADMHAKRRGWSPMQPGDANLNRKLSASDVLSIRAEFSEGRSTQRELAKRYGVSKTAIRRAIRRITWTTI